MLNSASVSAPLSWFCLRSQAKREHIAAANLRDRVSVEVFAPRIRAMQSTRRGIAINSTEALFPGYLFARFAYPDQVRHVMSTNGVVGVVAFGGRPPAIADSMIECLRREVAQAEHAPIAPVLEEGAWVRILSGCFRFLEGRVLNFDPRTERVRLLLTLLGSEVQVSLTADRVALLEEALPAYPSGLMTQQAEPSVRTRCAV
ncbi:MAG: transcription termination/antitermination NusG family protein [Verrucomicrobiota bacterium]